MDFICLDAETTDRGEILELSVYDIDCREIYHQYFKPERARRWRTDIHHITPAMVSDKPSARTCMPEIQDLIDNATHVIGFAVDNDVRILQSAGVRRLEDKHIVEVRQWYWLCVGSANGVDINGGPGLSVCASELGVELSDDDAHSASADTLATLKCFNTLADRFRQTLTADETEEAGTSLENLIGVFERHYAKARFEVMRQRAHGFLHIISTADGHKIVRSLANRPDPVVASIEIADRYKAELDLRRQFSRRRIKDSQTYFNLRPTDIEYFRNYTNTFDLDDSELSKHLLQFGGASGIIRPK